MWPHPGAARGGEGNRDDATEQGGADMKRGLLFIAAGLLVVTSAWGGTTGKIMGRALDTETGQTLPYANIILKGTTMGAAANESGEYFIINVPVGEYTLLGRMMGYSDVELQGVWVSADLTTHMDLKMTPRVIEAADVVEVVVERPLVDRGITASTRIVDGEAAHTAGKPVALAGHMVYAVAAARKLTDRCGHVCFRSLAERTELGCGHIPLRLLEIQHYVHFEIVGLIHGSLRITSEVQAYVHCLGRMGERPHGKKVRAALGDPPDVLQPDAAGDLHKRL